MGNFIVNALKSTCMNIVIFIVSILTFVFLILANVVALFVYPIWAWRNPFEASNSHSLTEVIGWSWLVDIVNPEKSGRSSVVLRFFQCILRPIDAAVVKLWNAWFMSFAPMKKRKHFIDTLGNNLQSLSLKTQEKYFKAVDFDREVYLIKNNMLSPEILPILFEYREYPFVEAGKLTDLQFRNLSLSKMETFCSKYDLNLQKQYFLIMYTFNTPEHYGPILRSYIMRKGLHPNAVSYFYEVLNNKENLHAELTAIPKALEYRQDLITVQQTIPENDVESCSSHLRLNKFRSYLDSRNEFGYDAQVAMCSAQYKIFHEQGLKMQPRAIYAKLARINKNNDSAHFVELMMRYNEFDGDEIAMHQIAGDEKLTNLWLQHLADKNVQEIKTA